MRLVRGFTISSDMQAVVTVLGQSCYVALLIKVRWSLMVNFLLLLLPFQGLYFAGLLLFHSGKYDKSREYIDRMLKMSPQSKQV